LIRKCCVQDAADGVSVEKDLEAGVKVLDSADLDFSRYADTLFEVLFAGGRLSTGGNLADEQKEKLATNVSFAALLNKFEQVIAKGWMNEQIMRSPCAALIQPYCMLH